MNNLIPKEQLNKLTPQQLRALEVDVDMYFLKIEAKQGEDYHSSFKKDPKIFKQFLKQTVSMQNSLYEYFLLQKARLNQLVYLYTIKGDEYDKYFNEIQWLWENEQFSGVLEIDIARFFDLGAESANGELKIDVDISSVNTPQAQFLRNYSLQLAGNINKTTMDRMKAQIAKSLDTTETTPQLADRLASILDNEKRAKVIANTESVRAFSMGRLEYTRSLGWQGKEWRVAPGACPICIPLNGKRVGIDEMFISGKISVLVPPAHPNCKCGWKMHRTVSPDQDIDVTQSTIDPIKINDDFFNLTQEDPFANLAEGLNV